MITKIDRDFVAADLAAVESLLARTSERDVLTSLNLKSRRDELKTTLSTLGVAREPGASAALFFSGKPVIGSRGIESEFGTEAVGKFQDVVTKMFALRQTGSLGQRGIVAGKEQSKLHITNVVHGSFGFRLEELSSQDSSSQTQVVSSPLKEAVDDTSRLMDSFVEADEEQFEIAVESLDDRVLATIRAFFELVSNNEAVFRLVSGTFDKSFNRQMVNRAAERAKITKIKETTAVFNGTLEGTLPSAGEFEYDTATERNIISGKIDPQLEGSQIRDLNRDWVGRNSKVTVRMRQVVRGEKIARETFTLLKIEEP